MGAELCLCHSRDLLLLQQGAQVPPHCCSLLKLLTTTKHPFLRLPNAQRGRNHHKVP